MKSLTLTKDSFDLYYRRVQKFKTLRIIGCLKSLEKLQQILYLGAPYIVTKLVSNQCFITTFKNEMYFLEKERI